MGIIRSVVIAIAICLSLATGKAFGSEQPRDSAQVSTTTAPDEQAFAGYERVTPGITPPRATHSPDPQYPDLPADTEPRGVVVMLIGVDTHGRVGPVHVVRSSAPVFEKSAVATVKTWHFKPAKKDGHALPVQITVEMNFAK
jgi:TonB family protein